MKQLTTLSIGVTAFGLIAATLFTSSFAAATGKVTTDVQVDILPGDVAIGATGTIDLGDYTISSSLQTVSGDFTSAFFVDDLKGADSGYYTTLQLSGNLIGPGIATISSGNVYFISTGTASDLITGTANTNVNMPASVTAYQSLDQARTYLKRDTAANSGIVGKYGNTPKLRIDIPAYSAVGSYTATLCYTLYEI